MLIRVCPDQIFSLGENVPLTILEPESSLQRNYGMTIIGIIHEEQLRKQLGSGLKKLND